MHTNDPVEGSARALAKLVVLTGGPGGGKTAVLELARRQFRGRVVVLPEAATIVFGGGFPRRETLAARRAAQRAIFKVQTELEAMALEEAVSPVILCDRGAVDGVAYWPPDSGSFWSAVGTTEEAVLARYAAVIHLRTPSADRGYNHENHVRSESAQDAARLDELIVAGWRHHPRRRFVDSELDFIAKAAHALDLIEAELPPLVPTT